MFNGHLSDTSLMKLLSWTGRGRALLALMVLMGASSCQPYKENVTLFGSNSGASEAEPPRGFNGVAPYSGRVAVSTNNFQMVSSIETHSEPVLTSNNGYKIIRSFPASEGSP